MKHVLNTVNGDFADETVAQNATKMESRDNDGSGLDFREHDRYRAKSVEEVVVKDEEKRLVETKEGGNEDGEDGGYQILGREWVKKETKEGKHKILRRQWGTKESGSREKT